MPHPEVLDEREPLGKPLAGSLVIHAAVISTLFVTWTFSSRVSDFGDPRASSGSMGISMVKTIPIPAKEGRTNRLANDTTSVVPQAPPEKKEKVKAPPPPDPKAIKIPTRNAVKKPQPEQVTKQIYKPEEIRPNQVYSSTQEALKSPNFAMQGNGGIGVGQNTQLGTRFGYYVDLMRQRIASKWNTGGLAVDQRMVLITFTIARDGSVRDPRVAQSSGNYTLDTSALRAVSEANPLPPLPPGFDKDSATVELWFQVMR